MAGPWCDDDVENVPVGATGARRGCMSEESYAALRVVARIRPLSVSAEADGDPPCLEQLAPTVVQATLLEKNKLVRSAVRGQAPRQTTFLSTRTFAFDAAYPPTADTADIFEAEVLPLVDTGTTLTCPAWSPLFYVAHHIDSCRRFSRTGSGQPRRQLLYHGIRCHGQWQNPYADRLHWCDTLRRPAAHDCGGTLHSRGDCKYTLRHSRTRALYVCHRGRGVPGGVAGSWASI